MVVPDRKVAPRSLPVRSWMVRMAKSKLRAFWLPSEFPSPETRVCRVLNVKFLYWWLSSTKIWSIPIWAKSMISSLRWDISWAIFSNLALRLSFRFSKPLIIALDTSFPCDRIVSKFSSTESSSACKIFRIMSGDWGILANWSCDMIMQS